MCDILRSRQLNAYATVVYSNSHLCDEVNCAWPVWVLSAQSFSSMLDGTWGYDKKDTGITTQKVSRKRERFTGELAVRLQNVQLERADALYVIQSRDTEHTFFH